VESLRREEGGGGRREEEGGGERRNEEEGKKFTYLVLQSSCDAFRQQNLLPLISLYMPPHPAQVPTVDTPSTEC
jgi:hypothetical protein